MVASKIAAVHADLDNEVHPFLPGLGLLIYEGVPSNEATTVLRSVAQHNAIPYRVKVRGCLPSTWCCVVARRAGCAGERAWAALTAMGGWLVSGKGESERLAVRVRMHVRAGWEEIYWHSGQHKLRSTWLRTSRRGEECGIRLLAYGA